MQRIVLFILFSMLSIQLSFSQQVRSRVDSTRFLIGDQTGLIIESAFNEAVDKIDFLKNTLDSFPPIEFIDQSSVYKESIGNSIVYRRTFLVAFFDTGAYYIPGIPVVIQNKGIRDTLFTAPIPIEVHTVRSDSTQVAPIKPIIKEPWVIWDAWPILAAVAVIGFLAFLIFWRRNKNKQEIEFVEIPKTPYELSMIALSNLEEEKFIQQGKIKEHYAQLSVILRSYLEQQFHFPALESTTREIGYGLDGAKFDTELKGDILSRLQHIDLIKFAKVQPDLDEVEHSLDRMRKQIQAIQQSFENRNSETPT